MRSLHSLLHTGTERETLLTWIQFSPKQRYLRRSLILVNTNWSKPCFPNRGGGFFFFYSDPPNPLKPALEKCSPPPPKILIWNQRIVLWTEHISHLVLRWPRKLIVMIPPPDLHFKPAWDKMVRQCVLCERKNTFRNGYFNAMLCGGEKLLVCPWMSAPFLLTRQLKD